jgi:hypothetical protein
LSFPLFDALAVTPALPVAFFFTRRRRPVVLLGLPSRPLPRRLPAPWAAIALARLHRTKTLVTAFQQTAARPRPAGRAFPPAVFLILAGGCRILDRAHGSVAPGKLMPRRGLASPPRRSNSGSVRTQDFIADEPGAAWWFLRFSFPASGGRGYRMSSTIQAPALSVPRFGTSPILRPDPVKAYNVGSLSF